MRRGSHLAIPMTVALPRSNISDMAHFIAQRDSTGDDLFISPPYRSAVSDKWFTAASRRLSNPDGSFAGIVTAPIDQAYLHQALSLDRSRRAMDPSCCCTVKDSFWRGNRAAGSRDWQVVCRRRRYWPSICRNRNPDPTKRAVSSMACPVSPATRPSAVCRWSILVSFGRADVLAPWYRHLYTFGLLVSAIVVAILFGTLVLVRQTNALAAKTRALARTNARFDAALSNMPHGLSMFDADERLLVSNSRYREMYELTAEQVKPGTPLSHILRDYKTEGTDFRLDSFLQGAKDRTSHILTLADGRMIEIQRTPMKDGGWVATHEDITEKRRAESAAGRERRRSETHKRTLRRRHQQHVAGPLPVRCGQAAGDLEQPLPGDVRSAGRTGAAGHAIGPHPAALCRPRRNQQSDRRSTRPIDADATKAEFRTVRRSRDIHSAQAAAGRRLGRDP